MAPETTTGGKGPRRIIGGVILVILLGGLAFGIYWFMSGSLDPPTVASGGSGDEGARGDKGAEASGPQVARVRHPDPARVTHYPAAWAPEGDKPPPAPTRGAFSDETFMQGMAVGLHGELPELDYATLFKEIRDLGATHVSLVLSWSMPSIRAVKVAPHPVETIPDEDARRWIREARAAGLKVMLFPILHIERRRSGEWRGKLDPVEPDRWWAAYTRFILHYADMAAAEDVELMAVGSELLSLESKRARWETLIKATRERYKGKLTYSANWDHFDHVVFWDLLDVAGMTGYFELSYEARPTLEELRETWEGASEVIATYVGRAGKPLMITEVGYPSQIGAAGHPWDYTRRKAPDQALQYLCFRAMYEVYQDLFAKLGSGDELPLHGVFVWNWYGYGGEGDITYNVRGKPAEAILRRWFRGRDPVP